MTGRGIQSTSSHKSSFRILSRLTQVEEESQALTAVIYIPAIMKVVAMIMDVLLR